MEFLTDKEKETINELILLCMDLDILKIVDLKQEKYKFTNSLFGPYFLIGNIL